MSRPADQRLRAWNGTALRVAIQAAGPTLVTPAVRPRSIWRVLEAIAPTLHKDSADAEAVLAVLSRTHHAIGKFCERNPEWLAAQIAAATTTPSP